MSDLFTLNSLNYLLETIFFEGGIHSSSKESGHKDLHSADTKTTIAKQKVVSFVAMVCRDKQT